ncbi:MAG: protease modulator HflC [bacterium]|nr:protease modulator HflC [bacterium]
MDTKNIVTALPLVAVALVVFVALSCTFIVDERHQAVVLRLNKPVLVITGDLPDDVFAEVKQSILSAAQRVDASAEGIELDPDSIRVKRGAGLYFKMPFVDTVELLPDVILEYDAEPREIILADKKKLMVDNFARWRIWNPLLYRVTVGNDRNARDRLDDIIYSVMREELGKSPLIEVIRTTNRLTDAPPVVEGDSPQSEDPMREEISRGREDIMEIVMKLSDKDAREYGISIIDVRLKRADLLRENLEAVFGRMKAERSRISMGYRSEGEREASIIRGQTDKDVQVILAQAERDARTLQGEGDAKALGIVAEAFGSNPDLYSFMRSLDVIETSTPPGSEFILGLDSSIYRLLETE